MVFTIDENIDPKEYRSKTRRSTMIIMAIFFVVGYFFAFMADKYIAPHSNNPILINFLGAGFGLFVTFLIVKTFFINADWMKEAMYAWRLKRSLMKINNHLLPLQKAEKENDIEAIKVLRYYHTGLKQMNKLEDNSHGLVDMVAEMNELEEKMQQLELDTHQISFDDEILKKYPLGEQKQD